MSNDTKDRIRKKLLGKYGPNKVGIWHIRGEDPNCDMSGCHSQPSLGYFKGEYRHVIEHALQLRDFFTWGAGGDINLIEVQPIDEKATKQLADARERVRRLDDELHNAKEALKRLGGES